MATGLHRGGLDRAGRRDSGRSVSGSGRSLAFRTRKVQCSREVRVDKGESYAADSDMVVGMECLRRTEFERLEVGQH